MRNDTLHRGRMKDIWAAIVVLGLLVWFTVGILIVAPYSGFYFNPSDGRIVDIYVETNPASLQIGDAIRRIGEISWDEYRQNRRLRFFKGAREGDVFEIVVERANRQQTIQWAYPGFNTREFTGRFFNIWLLAYALWLAGFAAQLSIRPKDLRWKLFIAANYLTALWLIFGSLSAWRLWESSVLLRAVTWLLLPVLIHLHWIFPRPLGTSPKSLRAAAYAAAGVLAATEFFHILPRSLYQIAFLGALGGSIILEGIHFVKHKDQRPIVGLLVLAVFLAFTPSAAFAAVVASGRLPEAGPLAFFSLPFMPLAYFFAIHRNRLGNMEVRLNRLITTYAFLILLVSALMLPVIPLIQTPLEHEVWIFTAMLIGVGTALATLLLFPPFQTYVEQRFLGVKLPYQNLQESYSSRIAASASINDLLRLLESEVFPSLFIRQFAFVQTSNGQLQPLLTRDVSSAQLPGGDETEVLLSMAGKYIPDVSPHGGWTRLILPLKAGDSFIGFWLLGRRDPDDLYPQAEIPILQSLANQTAIALSNILHAEQLRKMYQLDVERRERKQMRLALELHDSILNQLAVIRTNLDENSLPPEFKSAYDELTRRLREIVSDLRPPMLIYGLKPAITELAENLMERSGDSVKIKVNLQGGDERIPPQMEQHLFRIVQEACENALRHAEAKTIHIHGALGKQKVDLTVEDDGIGFDPGARLELDSLLSRNHFGVAGMIERARLIGAQIAIHSSPGAGARIHIAWRQT